MARQAEKQPLLKMTDVKKKAKRNTKMEEYELHDGAILKFYPIFSDNIVENMLVDFQEILTEANQQEFELDDQLLYHLLNYVAIKHATHLKKQLKDGFLNAMEALEALRESGYYREIIEEVFMDEQMVKLQDRIADLIAQSQVIEDIMNKAQQKFEDLQIANQDKIAQLENLDVTPDIEENE